jgi:anti-sigma B factor antagonist
LTRFETAVIIRPAIGPFVGGIMDNISVSISEYPQNKDVTLLAVKGFIDTTTAPEFEKKFLSVLGDKKYKLVVDLKDVNYISSAGWGIFISEIKRIRNQKGDLLLVGMNPEVSEVFELLEFNTILKSFPNVETAVKKGFEKS